MKITHETLVVLTTGKQDRGARATLAFSWACSALALGKQTAVFLTMDGTVWSMQNAAEGVQVEGFEPLSNYIETFLALGGDIMVCAPCAEYYCGLQNPKLLTPLIDGAELAGLTTVVSSAIPTCSIVTF